MSELFSIDHRAEADATNTYRIEELLVAYSPAAFFEPDQFGVDGTRRIRVRLSGDIMLYDLARRVRLESDEFGVDDHAVVAVVALGPSGPDTALTVDFLDGEGGRVWGVEARFHAIQLDLLCDFDRDGVVDAEHPGDTGWSWGPEGTGAVLLVNSDRDQAHPSREFRDRLDRVVNGPLDLDDMTRIVLSLKGVRHASLADCTIRLHVSDAAASRLRIFDTSSAIAEPVLGPGLPTAIFAARIGDRPLAVEGLDYPDAGFTGLISIAVDVERDGESLGGDEVTLRVAPWLALPNTQPSQRIFIAEMEDGSNRASIVDLQQVASAAGVPLEIVPPQINRRDRWLQDEVEIGFASRPGKRIPVVLDSPRDRELDRFPELMLLGPDFAYVTRGNDRQASSLDSFGNLECTPPHSGPHGDFPLGRILFGGAHPGGSQGRRMMKAVSDFIYAQQVQAPIELFSDWLYVGHIDEFLTFLPAPGEPGFRLALASPRLAIRMLKELAAGGGGDAPFMAGKQTETSAARILGDGDLLGQNERYQGFIDWNRNVLIQEMGLTPDSIIDIPALYYDDQGRASALFPGMINLQVVNDHIAIPKPFGPEVGGRCIFESYVDGLLTPLGLTCHYVDTYEGYFLQLGEIHCGTNVVRSPFQTDWWNFEPVSRGRSASARRIA